MTDNVEAVGAYSSIFTTLALRADINVWTFIPSRIIPVAYDRIKSVFLFCTSSYVLINIVSI